MTRFPAEFADLLNRRGQAILGRHAARAAAGPRPDPAKFALFSGILDPAKADDCRELVDSAIYPHVRSIDQGIPPSTITGMRQNYAELLPKTMRFKTAYFSSRSSMAYKAAARIGLFEMMKSESLACFAEVATGLRLARNPGVQAIVYGPGDYAGPHNDHHPENSNVRDGFVDLHVSLTSRGVAGQFLVCEEAGHLSTLYPLARNGSVAVYRLPFWHYTTPLQAKRSMHEEARRWLLLASFEIAQTT